MNSFPAYVLIQTVSYCNAKCLICPYEATVGKQPQGAMDDVLFRSIVDQVGKHPKQVKQVMPYLMNEPLMDKGLIDKIYYIRKQLPDVWIHIVTNGLLLTDEYADALLASPLNSIKVSMLAHRKETYEQVMGVGGYDDVLQNITMFAHKALSKKAANYFSVCLTNTPGYITTMEIEEAHRYWQTQGVYHEIIDHPISRAGNVSMLAPPHHDQIKGCNSIWRNEMIHILYNGDVVLCCMDWNREVVVGNLKTMSIEELWNSNTYNDIRAIIAGEKKGNSSFLCYRCEAADV